MNQPVFNYLNTNKSQLRISSVVHLSSFGSTLQNILYTIYQNHIPPYDTSILANRTLN